MNQPRVLRIEAAYYEVEEQGKEEEEEEGELSRRSWRYTR
jgi:hypothetical protein